MEYNQNKEFCTPLDPGQIVLDYIQDFIRESNKRPRGPWLNEASQRYLNNPDIDLANKAVQLMKWILRFSFYDCTIPLIGVDRWVEAAEATLVLSKDIPFSWKKGHFNKETKNRLVELISTYK